MVKDSFSNGEFVLHAGILNKADKGLCFIDELDKISPTDRDNLREAMEKGKVPINKGGISTELYSRATIIAGANPIEETFYLEDNIPLKKQNPLSDALRSRFDLSYYIYYEPNIQRDKKVIQRMTRARMGDISLRMSWDQDFIRKYIHYARTNIFPKWKKPIIEKIDEEAPNLLWQFKGNLYYRQIETLYRLAEASARSRLSNTIKKSDVELALLVLKDSLQIQENGQEASSDSVNFQLEELITV